MKKVKALKKKNRVVTGNLIKTWDNTLRKKKNITAVKERRK